MKQFYLLIAAFAAMICNTVHAADDYVFDLSALDLTICEGANSYDSETYTLTNQDYDFAGWKIAEGLDISEYDYLVVELQEAQTCGLQVRLYDEDGYYASHVEYNCENGASTVTIPLSGLTKNDDDATALDLTHIYIVGFWSYAGEIKFKSVYLTTDEAIAGDYFDMADFDANLSGSTGTCEYDETTGAYTVLTDKYGFAGWHYTTPADFSDYKYLVIELAEPQDSIYCGARLRLYDEDNYYAAYANYVLDNTSTKMKVELSSLVKADDNGTEYGAIDLTSIYYAGFWTYGDFGNGTPSFKLKSVYLSNDEDEDETVEEETGITFVQTSGDYFDFDELNVQLWDPDGLNSMSYDEETGAYAVTFGDYTQAGWEYSVADFSKYKYLVVELSEASTCGTQVRIWDSGSDNYTLTELGSETQIVIDLTTEPKKLSSDDSTEAGETLDLDNITKVAFWSFAGTVNFKSVYLANDEDSAFDEEEEEDEDDDETGVTFVETSSDYFDFDELDLHIWDLDEANSMSYDEETGAYAVTFGDYTQAGWEYSVADFSKYKYLVVELSEASTCGTQVRIWDGNNDNYTLTEFGSETQIVIDLTTEPKKLSSDDSTEAGETLDLDNITKVAFWSFAGTVSFKSVYLANDEDSYTQGISTVGTAAETGADTRIYSISGILQSKLQKGINIVGGKKVIVK